MHTDPPAASPTAESPTDPPDTSRSPPTALSDTPLLVLVPPRIVMPPPVAPLAAVLPADTIVSPPLMSSATVLRPADISTEPAPPQQDPPDATETAPVEPLAELPLQSDTSPLERSECSLCINVIIALTIPPSPVHECPPATINDLGPVVSPDECPADNIIFPPVSPVPPAIDIAPPCRD